MFEQINKKEFLLKCVRKEYISKDYILYNRHVWILSKYASMIKLYFYCQFYDTYLYTHATLFYFTLDHKPVNIVNYYVTVKDLRILTPLTSKKYVKDVFFRI